MIELILGPRISVQVPFNVTARVHSETVLQGELCIEVTNQDGGSVYGPSCWTVDGEKGTWYRPKIVLRERGEFYAELSYREQQSNRVYKTPKLFILVQSEEDRQSGGRLKEEGR